VFNIINFIKDRLYWRNLYKKDIFQWRLEKGRSWGAKIGDRTKLYCLDINDEPLLLEIGEHVVVADGVRFITHDGGVWVFWDEHPELDNYGKIIIGNNVFIGMNSIILPNTTIGNNCVIGAGSVVRGKIPDDSVLMGNPAKVIMKTSLYRKMQIHSKKTLPTALIPKDKEGLIKRDKMLRECFYMDKKDGN